MFRDPNDSSRITTGEPPASVDRRKNAGSLSELPEEADVPFLRDENGDSERRDGSTESASDGPGEPR